MDRSFEDDRRNMFEQVKSLLLAKLTTIEMTLGGHRIVRECVEEVRSWSYDGMANVEVKRSNERPASFSQANMTPSAFRSNH